MGNGMNVSSKEADKVNTTKRESDFVNSSTVPIPSSMGNNLQPLPDHLGDIINSSNAEPSKEKKIEADNATAIEKPIVPSKKTHTITLEMPK